MTTQPRKLLIFRWTAPRNLLAILIFVIFAVIIQYVIIASTRPTAGSDPTTITLPFNITISFLYHLLPAAVIITLTASFTYLTTRTAILPRRAQPSKPLPQKPRQKPTRLEPLRRFYKKLERAYKKVKNRMQKTPTVVYIEHRIALQKVIIKSAAAVTATFIAMILLVTMAAYPESVPTATVNFYQWNTAFLNFVVATIRASETISNTVSPIGAIATAIYNAFFAAAPAFRNTLQGAASSITSGLVALAPTEKYLIIQNAAAWTVAVVAMLYSQYAKTRRYRR